MAFIKEEIEDLKITEVFSLKQEDTEEQTDLMPLKEESQDLNEMEEKHQHEKPHQFMTGKEHFSDSEIEKTSSQNKGARNMKVQTGKSPFTCQQCGRSFGLKKTLNRHMKIHTGVKLFACQQCGKSYSDSRNLNAHMNLHTGERPFTCSQCGKSYTQKKHLINHESIHIRAHTGERPYKCLQCEKTFMYHSSVKRHLQTLHLKRKLHVSVSAAADS